MTVVPAPDADLVDRAYLSQFATDRVGMILQDQNGPVDPDGSTMSVSMSNDASLDVVFTGLPAGRADVGTYFYDLTSDDTSVPGPYTITFDFTHNSVDDHYDLHFEIGSSAPAYDALPWDAKQVVEAVWIRFADLFDSPLGGPHLQVYLQSHFGRNRLAQLLLQTQSKLNALSMPQTSYTIASFPYITWGSLLIQSLYVEVIKHLRRSYVEQPDIILGTAISRTDRRDYTARWGEILQDEADELRTMFDNWKMANMGLGNVSVLISGGAFGNYGPTAASWPGQAAARGYYYPRRVW